ncbi:hypothetical protein HGRIS_006587 [Hohenbuehelia grisea]|uniref:Alpha-type protein kinase domain-containing protein n=1 Tax=Hohenbuehelia grisea TaxID=104357 RepID=A0ABR3JA15_9AGAR
MPDTGPVQTCNARECKAHAQATSDTPGPLEASSSANSISASISEANQARALATAGRLKNLNQMKNIGPTTPLTTDVLLSHEHGGGAPGEPKTMVAWNVRFSNQPKRVDDNIGNAARKFANSLPMPDLLKILLDTVNVEWTRSHSTPLAVEDASIRFHGNRVLEPNTMTLNLGHFYTHYSSPSNAAIYVENPPKNCQHLRKKNSPLLCLEIYIDYESWFCRTHEDSENNSLPVTTKPSRKRSRVESTTVASTRAKQTRKSTTFSSGFTLGKAIPTARSAVFLKIVTCSMNVENARPQLHKGAEVLKGMIHDQPFAKGLMKAVFDLELVSKADTYVGKRFFRLDDEASLDLASSTVTVADNKIHMEAELVRSAWGSWFLAEFFARCEKSDIAIYRNIAFADVFLAKETETPSIASGVGIIIDEEEDGITWLVEKKRSTSVLKFSGTLSHKPQRRDQLSQTIYAFAHFVWGYSNNTLVFADIQGTPTRLDGKDGLVLFDIMTHTVDGDSGVGDCGKEGIETFLDDHQCLDICKRLCLPDSIPLTLPSTKSVSSHAKQKRRKTDRDIAASAASSGEEFDELSEE